LALSPKSSGDFAGINEKRPGKKDEGLKKKGRRRKMSFTNLRKIPKPQDILKQMPLPSRLASLKEKRDKTIKDIFRKDSKKFLLIIGPCSADDKDAIYEYALRLSLVQEKVKHVLVLVPRIYTNKPRTTAEGYKGMVHQPDPCDQPNIVEGIKAIRQMHMHVLDHTGLSSADEMLYPGNYPYLEDLLSYVAIGARSVENQEHRLTVSGLDIPAGMKNPTSGDIGVMLNSVYAAQKPHIFIYNGWEVKTAGNPFAHCILRGAVNQYGQNIPNYHYESLMQVAEAYRKRGLVNPGMIIDTNHANSGKDFREQPRIAKQVLHSMQNSSSLRDIIKGLMIESYLEEGSQSPAGKVKGQSITDPCLGWKDSEKLILDIAERIAKI
jgi:3-deoxy-7-phosphoheptulonate synthase